MNSALFLANAGPTMKELIAEQRTDTNNAVGPGRDREGLLILNMMRKNNTTATRNSTISSS
jgi:hypothetical protein